MASSNQKTRCDWVNMDNPEYVKYHDMEWGRAIRYDQKLYQALCFEGAQAGLSWETILKKRDNYYAAFDGLNIEKMAEMSEADILKKMNNPGLIRNKLKLLSLKKNALGVKGIQKEYGSFSNFLWSFTQNKIIHHHFKNQSEYLIEDERSKIISSE